MSLPSITISGGLVADVALRFTSSGKAVATFRVGASQRKKTDAGGWVDGDSCYLDVSVWEQKAEACAEMLQRGSKVVVTGVLKQRSWEKDGQTHYAYEVQAYDVALVVKARTADRERPSEPTTDPWSTGGQGQPQNDDPWASPGDQKVPF